MISENVTGIWGSINRFEWNFFYEIWNLLFREDGLYCNLISLIWLEESTVYSVDFNCIIYLDVKIG